MQDQKTLDNVLTLNNPSDPIILEEGNLWHQVLLHYTELPANLPQSLENFNSSTKIFVFFSQNLIENHGLLLSQFLSDINVLALQAQCQNVTLITRTKDVKEIDRGNIDDLIHWLESVYAHPLFTPIFISNETLFDLFEEAISNCFNLGWCCDFVYLMHASARFSENFLPYLSENIASDLFDNAFFKAISRYRVKKEELVHSIFAELNVMNGGYQEGLGYYMQCLWAQLLSHMKKLPRLSPMLEALEYEEQGSRLLTEEQDSCLLTLECPSDDSDKENKLGWPS